jgi:hypothetical protein
MRLSSCLMTAVVMSATAAWATPVDVAVVDGATATVVVDGEVVGQAPMTLDVASGPHVIAFRSSAFSPTAFDVRVDVADVPIRVEADWSKQVASAGPRPSVTAAPLVPVAATGSVAAAAATPAAPVGDVFVTSEPAGSPISVDGVVTGLVTPALVSGLSSGKHRVDVANDCERAFADVTVREALVARAELKLERGTGTLKFASTPAGATVVVDGKEVGRTPMQLSQVACGDHTWAVRLAGYLPLERSGFVPAFKTTEVAASLEKERFGTLVFLPQPVDAALSLDGVALGVGPRTVEHVGVGPHTLVGVRDGYQTRSMEIQVVPDAVSRIEVVLSPPVVEAAAAPDEARRPPKEPRTKRKPAPVAPLADPPVQKEPAAVPVAPSASVTPSTPVATESATPSLAPAAAPTSKSFRQASAPRLVVNSAATVGALTAVGFGVRYWVVAGEWYQGYLATEDAVEAEYLYVEQVVPRRNLAIITTGVGAALLGVSGALWGTTDFGVAPTGNGVVVGGKF